ncbi:MAG: SAM-dependent methyltransferase [Chloroflexi bacterium]|nr:SAM-dependent methyltransferase [Chloroflexota bacterium]
MNQLADIMRREMTGRGAITFARFMELALYCPGLGYYESPGIQVGRRGDFYTNVSVGRLFGELLAFQFAGWLEESGAGSGQLLEAGAHDGQWAADILNWLLQWRPEILARLEYWILEPSERRRLRQQETLAPFKERVRWFSSWAELPATGVRGAIFSNELLDAFPVHRIGWDAARQQWFEWGVSEAGDHFAWARLPVDAHAQSLESDRVSWPKLPSEVQAMLPDGFTTEMGLAAQAWWRQAAQSLAEGRLLTIDYGLETEQFLAPQRAQGTLRAYHRHHAIADLLAMVGEQDLTAHINFSDLRRVGEEAGLETAELTAQATFLTRIAEKTWRSNAGFGEWTSARVRQFQTLTHPEHLGRSFQVLVQSRCARGEG